MNKNISNRISFLGFFMTCFIVMYHIGTPNGLECFIDQKFNTFVGDIFSSLAVIAMCYFFCVTGFLLFHNLNILTYKQKIIRRIKTLFLPYMIWQILAIIIRWIMYRNTIQIPKLLQTIFLLQRWPPDGALWYLYAVFILAILSITIIPLLKHKKIFWIFAVFLTLMSREVYHISPITPIFQYGIIPNFMQYLPAYIVGAFYGYYFSENDDSNPLIFVLSLMIIALLFDTFHGGLFYFTATRMIPIFILYLFPLPEKILNKPIYKLSFLMYGLHQIFSDKYVTLVKPIFIKITKCAIVFNIFGRFLFLLIVILLAFIIHKILKKISPKALNILTGSRS